jgi:hypothetical protein
MGRAYAAVLGPLAFATITLRGVMHHAGVLSTIKLATVTLVLFTAFGYLVGAIAELTVRESVLSHFQSGLTEKPDEAGEETA